MRVIINNCYNIIASLYSSYLVPIIYIGVTILYVVQENVLLSYSLQWYNSLKKLNVHNIFTIEKANVANIRLVIINDVSVMCACVCVCFRPLGN